MLEFARMAGVPLNVDQEKNIVVQDCSRVFDGRVTLKVDRHMLLPVISRKALASGVNGGLFV